MRRIYSRAPSFFITRGDSICPCALRIITQTTTTAVCGGTPRMQTPKNMNVQAEQSVAGTFITPQNTRCGCSFVLSHPRFITLPFYHTPKHTLWMFGRAITPPFLSHPLGTDASCTLSPGVHNITHPPQYNTPGDNIFKPQNVITGVSYIVSFTVYRRVLLKCSSKKNEQKRRAGGEDTAKTHK